jgi:hypothetical protein
LATKGLLQKKMATTKTVGVKRQKDEVEEAAAEEMDVNLDSDGEVAVRPAAPAKPAAADEEVAAPAPTKKARPKKTGK